MRDRVPDMEYFFCDTGAELPETYEYLNKLEAVLGKPIARLNSDKGFDHWFEVFRGALPSPQMRWCTKNMKIKPLEAWLGDSPAISYVGIRADESNRKGYISTKPSIKTSFPFVEDGIDHAGVLKILDEAGVGLPSYYEWRTRSGCYFCFYQRKVEWIGLKNNHPDLFESAKKYEKESTPTGRRYTWSPKESLDEIASRETQIVKEYEKVQAQSAKKLGNKSLIEIFDESMEELDEQGPGCIVCDL